MWAECLAGSGLKLPLTTKSSESPSQEVGQGHEHGQVYTRVLHPVKVVECLQGDSVEQAFSGFVLAFPRLCSVHRTLSTWAVHVRTPPY